MHDVTDFNPASHRGLQKDATLKNGTLLVVATPIGNKDDLAPRARMVLSEVDLIAAEDTRHTGRLLSHFGIKTPLLPLHDHNEADQVPRLIDRLLGGQAIALVSDAGTPLVSDPGYRLVTAAHEAGIAVSPVPGASAVLAALSVAGLPSDRFCFEGFLPPRAEARRATLTQLQSEPRTMIFLESVHKIRAALPDMADAFGPDRLAFIGREMTKLHEQCVRAPLGRLAAMFDAGEMMAKGEFVIVVAGTGKDAADDPAISVDALLDELVRVLPGRQAADIVSRVTGRRRNEVYRDMLALKDSSSDGE